MSNCYKLVLSPKHDFIPLAFYTDKQNSKILIDYSNILVNDTGTTSDTIVSSELNPHSYLSYYYNKDYGDLSFISEIIKEKQIKESDLHFDYILLGDRDRGKKTVNIITTHFNSGRNIGIRYLFKDTVEDLIKFKITNKIENMSVLGMIMSYLSKKLHITIRDKKAQDMIKRTLLILIKRDFNIGYKRIANQEELKLIEDITSHTPVSINPHSPVFYTPFRGDINLSESIKNVFQQYYSRIIVKNFILEELLTKVMNISATLYPITDIKISKIHHIYFSRILMDYFLTKLSYTFLLDSNLFKNGDLFRRNNIDFIKLCPNFNPETVFPFDIVLSYDKEFNRVGHRLVMYTNDIDKDFEDFIKHRYILQYDYHEVLIMVIKNYMNEMEKKFNEMDEETLKQYGIDFSFYQHSIHHLC